MTLIAISATDRLHMTVWRGHPSAPGDPGWCVAPALNGCPIAFAEHFQTAAEALAAAFEHVAANGHPMSRQPAQDTP